MVAVNLVKPTATTTNNYWSPLACLVKEQEKTLELDGMNTSIDLAMTATTTTISLANKVVVHWVQKLYNREQCKMGILDTGATSGAALEEDEECFNESGKVSTKTFMFQTS